MNPVPRDRSARRDLALAAAIALAALLATALFDLHYLASGVLPGVWLVLHAHRRHRCPAGRAGPA